MNIYDWRRAGTALFLIVAVVLVGSFLYISNNLVSDLARQERERMQIWADATKQIADIGLYGADNDASSDNLDFLISIIEQNHTIPVVLTDDDGNILDHRNFDLPVPPDSLNPYYLAPENEAFLRDKLASLSRRANVIHIIISPDNLQHLYWDDSKLLRRLSFYPYVQLAVMLAFILVVYFAVNSTRRAEQNKVWVGLSKETAHQLGTPISSLMAWMELLPALGVDPQTVSEMRMELLPALGVDPQTVSEMNKDVTRLSTIASRFSKIGSRPKMEPEDFNTLVFQATSYMSTRISSRIALEVHLCDRPLPVSASAPLMEWVMENLIKNAVDAMEGSGSITVTTFAENSMACVTVTDTGKGIPRKNHKTVFNPGYTTKKRGWGLGLALAKRIIGQYHGGRIFVERSEPGRGTTFRINLPLK